MERLHFEYAASQPIKQRAHVGVVGSGDLEVLLEPSPDQKTHVTVTTSVDGFGKTWKLVLDRFFSRYQYAASIEIHDFGATPGTVALRPDRSSPGAWSSMRLILRLFGWRHLRQNRATSRAHHVCAFKGPLATSRKSYQSFSHSGRNFSHQFRH
jgi:malonate decarboxylase delta subunit